MTETQDAARAVAESVKPHGFTVAVAESVTAGHVAAALAAAPEASEWFSGSVVAYRTQTKRDVLGVTSQKIVSRDCARQMAEGVLRATGSDVAVATTGVGGPDPEEGRPAGTVIICAGSPDDLRVFEHEFAGSPEHIVHEATLQALRHLLDAGRRATD